MKDKIITAVIFFLSFAAGSTVGNVISHFIWPQKSHVCRCETCRAVRRAEAAAAVDSVVRERIVISINGREQ